MSVNSSSQATPDGSLESAARGFEAFDGLLSQREDSTAPEQPPEQRSTPKAEKVEQPKAKPAEQAPPASEEEESPAGSEAATQQTQQNEEGDDAPEVRRLKVNLPDGEQELPEDEVIKGYLRTADYTRKTMELARQRKEFEEREVSAIRGEREQYRVALTQLEAALQPPEEPDWAKLKLVLPAEELSAKLLDWQENQKRIVQVRTERERVEAKQREDAEVGFRSYVQEQHDRLAEALPEFGDPEKAPALKKELSAYAKSKGFTDDDLANVVDHRLVLLLHDAMQHHKAQANAPKVENKIERARVTTAPGPSRQTAPKSGKLDAAKTRLKETGSIDDAARAFAEIG